MDQGQHLGEHTRTQVTKVGAVFIKDRHINFADDETRFSARILEH